MRNGACICSCCVGCGIDSAEAVVVLALPLSPTHSLNQTKAFRRDYTDMCILSPIRPRELSIESFGYIVFKACDGPPQRHGPWMFCDPSKRQVINLPAVTYRNC